MSALLCSSCGALGPRARGGPASPAALCGCGRGERRGRTHRLPRGSLRGAPPTVPGRPLPAPSLSPASPFLPPSPLPVPSCPLRVPSRPFPPPSLPLSARSVSPAAPSRSLAALPCPRPLPAPSRSPAAPSHRPQLSVRLCDRYHELLRLQPEQRKHCFGEESLTPLGFNTDSASPPPGAAGSGCTRFLPSSTPVLFPDAGCPHSYFSI